ncbi:MAG TPA: SdrD B-like domain-containing protein [Terriglobales bacterium]|nr:SdrD B-like domain-containing protein [Terriglobales bacterium]
MSLCVLVCSLSAVAEVAPPEVVEISWQDARTISLPGVSQVVVVDDSISRAEISGDNVRLFGLARGETAAFAWVAGRRIAFRINVVQPPATRPAPHLAEAAQYAGYGSFGSSSQYANDSSGNSRLFLQHQFSWEQNSGPGHLSIRTQATDTLGASAPGFNLPAGSVQYRRPGSAINVLDFPLHVNGTGSIAPLPNSNAVALRGADFLLQAGANSYEVFAGATPSYYYLTLTGTKDVAGFTFSHTRSDSFELYSTAAMVNASPVSQLSTGARELAAFDTTGILFRPARHVLVQASGGASTQGGMAQGAVTYAAGDWSAFVAASRTSSDFPLNRLQMFTASKSSMTSAARYRFTRQVDSGVYYQHASGASVLHKSSAVSSDLVNPNVTLLLTPGEALSLNYSYSETRGDTSTSQHGNRFDVALNSQLPGHAANTVQLDVGQLRDPLQLRTASDLSVRDSVSVPFKGHSVWFNFQHRRTSKSLASLLNGQLGLLSPALQQLFLEDPPAFVNSPNLPPEALAILRSLQPTDTEASACLQLYLSRKLQFRPTFAYQHSALSGVQRSNNKNFGYALLYEASPSFELQSSLTSMFLYDSVQSRLQRSTVFSVGAQKTFRASPARILPARRWHTIQGRVFRDVNANGAFNEGEAGIAGLRVELDGARVAVTDAQGQYEFPRVLSGRHTLQLPLAQFNHNVRVTTPVVAEVELLEKRTAEADFGIVDFARLMGTVYNDYAMGGVRRTDAPGLRGVQLMLQGSNLHRVTAADSAGEFEFDDLPPGDYTLTVEPATVPANFIVPPDSMRVRLGPTSTVVRDIPLRALRSLSGHVYLKTVADAPPNPHKKAAQLRPTTQPAMQPDNPTRQAQDHSAAAVLKPLAGIRIMAGEGVATTDADGSFMLRQLPAGEVEVRLLPISDLPPGIKAPAGRVQMPREPMSVAGATIVISNPELLKYLVDKAAISVSQ